MRNSDVGNADHGDFGNITDSAGCVGEGQTTIASMVVADISALVRHERQEMSPHLNWRHIPHLNVNDILSSSGGGSGTVTTSGLGAAEPTPVASEIAARVLAELVLNSYFGGWLSETKAVGKAWRKFEARKTHAILSVAPELLFEFVRRHDRKTIEGILANQLTRSVVSRAQHPESGVDLLTYANGQRGKIGRIAALLRRSGLFTSGSSTQEPESMPESERVGPTKHATKGN